MYALKPTNDTRTMRTIYTMKTKNKIKKGSGVPIVCDKHRRMHNCQLHCCHPMQRVRVNFLMEITSCNYNNMMRIYSSPLSRCSASSWTECVEH